ncbi:MAG: PKD domain-containing protein [Methanobacteriota archaeon]|nr:MAG: PKD domain-containing protein [Euryarchaeota archaeon]
MDESKHYSRRCVTVIIALTFIGGIMTVLPAKAIDLPSDAWIKGNVSDSLGPIPNSYVKVMMFTAGGVDINWTFSDALGDYEIGVPGGFDYMIFAANGSYMMSMNQVSVLTGETKWVNFTLDPIAVEADVTIKGYVKDSEGASRDDGHVLGIVYDPMGDDMPEYANLTVPKPDGYFEVNVIPSTGGGGAVAMDFPGFNMIENSTEDPLVGGETYWFNITLEAPSYDDNAMLYGYVTVSGSLTPIANALVAIEIWNEDPDGGYSNYTFTDANGHYEMNVTNGSARLMISKGGYSMAMFELEILPFVAIQRNAELTPVNCVVKGNVTDGKSSDPMEYATVFIWYGGGEMSITNTNESGFYEMKCVAGENLYMSVEVDNYSRGVAEIDLLPGDEKWQDFELWPVSAWIEGNVTDFFDGTGIANARVEADSEGYYEEGSTDDFGYYNLSVPQGTYDVRITATDYWENESTVEVLDGMATKHDVRLMPWDIPEFCRLYGWVNDTDSGTGIDGATVYIELTDGGYSDETYSASNGSYEIFIPAAEIKYLVTARMHYPAYGVFDAEGLVDERMDFTLDADMYRPNITYTQEPIENLTWFNPTVIDIEIEEPNIESFMLLQWMFWKMEDQSGDEWEYFYLVDMKSTSFNPLDPYVGLPYLQLGDNYTIHQEWNATIPSAGWLQNGDDSHYVVASEQWWGPDHYYALRGYYTNDTLTDVECSAYFDADTGEIQLFWFDWMGEADPDDPSATFNVEVMTYAHNTSDWNQRQMGDRMQLGPLDVIGLEFIIDEIVPSGRYMTLFGVNDFGYQSNGDLRNLTVDNDPPSANAGPNRDEVVNTTVELNASLSSDNGWIESYEWVFDDGGLVTLYGEVVDYVFTSTGEYEIMLTVTDGAEHFDFDMLVITVNDDMPPVANAGPDMTVPENTLAVFNGSDSYDDVGIANYSWTIVELSEPLNGEVCNYTFTDLGDYTVELVVIDTIGQQSEPDIAVITVVDVTAPVANAGLDRIVPIGTEVTLDGSDSSDNHEVVNYTWTFTDDVDVTLYGMEVDYTFLTPGEHVVTLTVEDAAANSDTDTVLITIEDGVDPVADAGSDITVAIGEEVTFNGSGSSDNSGIIESYSWTFEYDGQERELLGVSANFTFEIAGEYVVTLTVEDAAGNYDTDTVTVRVNAPPVADAGDAISADVGEEVTFDGSGSSDDSGVIVSYTWTFEYDGLDRELNGVSPSFVFDIAGEYVVTLTVEDAAGLTDTDEVVVTIVAEGDEESFLESYWWVLAIIAIVVVAGVASAAMMMSKKGGKGGEPEGKPVEPEEPMETEDMPPPPDDL